MTILTGSGSHDILMLPVLLGCYRDIYHKRIKGTEKTSAQRKISATIRNTLRDLIGREYWGMTADEIDAFCDYMDNMADKLNWHIMGMQRAVYNCYDGWAEDKKEIISWSITAHSIAYILSQIRKKIFPPTQMADVEIDRKRIQGRYELLDSAATEYARLIDNRTDAVFTSDALDGINNAARTLIDKLMEIVNSDID